MPKPLHSVDPEKISLLKEALYRKASFVLSTKNHCKILSQMIWAMQSNSGLSESTLYRFFFAPVNGHSFYLETLNILSAFAGYHSWANFCRQQSQDSNHHPSDMELVALLGQSSEGMLTQWIHNGNATALKKYFISQEQPFSENYKWETGVKIPLTNIIQTKSI